MEKKAEGAFLSKIKVLGDIFTPMIPAFIASGMCNGFSKLVFIFMEKGVLPHNGVVLLIYNIFLLIGKAFLVYLSIFTGVRAAKELGADEMLGGMIGAASLSPVINEISKLMGWYNEDVVNDSVLSSGSGGIIGVIVGVLILSKIEKWLHRHMPEVIDLSFTPLIAMLIAVPFFVLAVMPVTGWLSIRITKFLNLFILSDNPIVSIISGYILAALFLPLVILGLSRGLVPVYALQIESIGATTLFPAVAMAGAGQVGAAIALYIKAKKSGNEKMRQIIAGAIPAGIMGIGEPLIYGVTLPMVKPFITAGLGAGFGGAYVMMTHVMSTAYSPSGILAVTHMLPESMLNYLLGVLISYIAGALITYIIIPLKEVENA